MSRILSRLDDSTLKKLFLKYNQSNIEDGKGRSKYYFIPKELVVTDYISKRTNVTKTPDDNLESYDNWVNCKIIREVLEYSCNMSIQEYFDLLILHITDTDDRPKCDDCGEYLNWSNSIYFGYSTNGYQYKLNSRHFHNHNCRAHYLSTHPDEYVESMALTACTEFYDKGDASDPCEFYIASTSTNLFKFGVCEVNSNRDKMFSEFNGYTYLRRKVLFYGTRSQVAELEYNVKIFRKDFHEALEWKDIRSFLNAYPKALNKMLVEYPD